MRLFNPCLPETLAGFEYQGEKYNAGKEWENASECNRKIWNIKGKQYYYERLAVCFLCL